MLTPHVVVQDVLEPDATHAIVAPPRVDRYRLFVRGGATATVRVEAAAPAEVSVKIAGDRIEPREFAVAPEGTLRIQHDDPRARHLKIERIENLEQAATAQQLALLPEFRATFGTELLRPGVALRVSTVALVFTDLTGSTALYAEIGDARAFKLVHDHFDTIEAVVASHRGAIVKTIGDAVMAAFDTEIDALTAAVAMHRGFGALRRDNPDARRTSLKIGAFAGPCYAVTANGVLDYFGQSVNVAARVQGEAAGGELVVESSLAELATNRGLVEPSRVRERYVARLKGVPDPIALCRLSIDDDA
jgi:class 3 adenylate cyclase